MGLWSRGGWGQVEVYGLCCSLKSYRCLCAILLLGVIQPEWPVMLFEAVVRLGPCYFVGKWLDLRPYSSWYLCWCLWNCVKTGACVYVPGLCCSLSHGGCATIRAIEMFRPELLQRAMAGLRSCCS